ncbi:MAG: hypothetical protein RIT35_1603 [Pseudomonadota bacterium]|jgi:hypothetical protein
MAIKIEFDKLVTQLKSERDEIALKIHLASMDAKEDFESAEKIWDKFKVKVNELADESKETSEELITKAKIVGEELKETYNRINERISK